MRRRLLALVLGIVVTFAVLEASLNLGYRGYSAWLASQNRPGGARSVDEIRILCIGESTTAVAGDKTNRVLSPATAYPVRLEEVLNRRQSLRTFRVYNYGVMGGTSSIALERLREGMEEVEPDMVVAMMGIKDTPTERMPALSTLPTWLADLKTVQLVAWLTEDVRLRRDQVDLDPGEDPELIRSTDWSPRNYVRETRVPDEAPEALGPLRVAMYYWFIGRVDKALEQLDEVQATWDVGHSLRARVLVSAGRQEEAIALLRKTMKRHPEELMYAVALAEIYMEQGKLFDAEVLLRSTLVEADEDPDRPYVAWLVQAALADALRLEGWLREADELTEDEADSLPDKYNDVLPQPWLIMGTVRAQVLMDQGRWSDAEEILLYLLSAVPTKQHTLFLLSVVYRNLGEPAKEEAIRRQLLANSDRLAEYFELAKLLKRTGHADAVPDLMAVAVQRIPSLKASYRDLYHTAQRTGATVVVMQYPSFSLATLHLYAPPAHGVLFVDNEHVFDADPTAYFYEPRFPQSFSHYTYEGARVLAEHLADTVLEYYGLADAP